jgi:DNA-binding NtrC family response regulator
MRTILDDGLLRALAKTDMRIVLVDPEPVVRDTIKAILEHDGHEVVPANDPQAALEIIQRGKTALVITNVNLPGMSGHDAMRMFKKGCPGVPVLMVSGLPESETIRHWMAEDGFDAFPKPFSAQQLSRKVRQVLSESAS